MSWEWLDNIKELIGEPMTTIGPHTNWNYCLANIVGNGNTTIGSDTGSEYVLLGGDGIYRCSLDEDSEVSVNTSYDLYIRNQITSSGSASFELGIGSNHGRYVQSTYRPTNRDVNCITFRFAINREIEEAVIIYIVSTSSLSVYAFERIQQEWARKELYTTLINSIVANAKIKVNYYLPDYEYTYAKITYKQNSEPASETDGKSVEILKDETSVNIEGLEEKKTYYFKIFTDKSESEAFPYTVTEIG